MGTVLEGDLDKVLSMVRQMHESVFEEGVQRVVTIVNTVAYNRQNERPVVLHAVPISPTRLTEPTLHPANEWSKCGTLAFNAYAALSKQSALIWEWPVGKLRLN